VSLADGDPYLGLVLAGKYEIEELIGEGAMGRVYKAKQLALGKPFAAKILAPHLLHDEQSQARFAAEAHNAASLNHPNCVSVLDYGQTPQGVAYIVMDYIKGVTLERIIAEQFPLAQERMIDLALQILAALIEAHGLGILHRDLKPENILVQQLRTHGELAKVLDFGIAKLMEDQTASGPGLTTQGMVCGTPEYMSPEQARGQKLDQRSDLYAVGVILYQMMTGRPPFESSSAVEVLHKHLNEEPIPPSRLLGTPPLALEAVCLRALAKDPNNRYATAAEFREELIGANNQVPPGIRCSRCDSEVRPEHRFCPSCGAEAPDRPRERTMRRHPSRGVAASDPQQKIATAELVVASLPLPLVGRDLVMQRMRGVLGRPHPGVRMRVLAGARGSGRTRLGDEIASLAESLSWRAYYVAADPSGCCTPLWPVRAMVAQLLELDPATVSTQDLGRVANTTGLSFEEQPGLAELFLLQGPAHALELGVRRRECFASAVQSMLTGGRGQPLLLLFDDIDEYDTASREVLRRLSSAHAADPVVVVCTTAEKDHQWLDGSVEPLEPLTADVIESLAREATRDINPESKLPEILAATAPVTPLRLENHLRLLAAGVPAPKQATVEELIQTRLERLEPSRKSLVDVAAVLGERFSDDDFAALIARDANASAIEATKQGLRDLHIEGLLIVTGNGERAFGHPLLHELAYAAVAQGRRRELHAIIAKRLAGVKMATTARAVHLFHAQAKDAVRALYDAAVQAERSFDDALAADFVRRLASIVDPVDHAKLGVGLALLAARVMRTAETHPIAIEIISSRVDAARTPAEEGRLLAALGHVQARAGLHAQAVTTLKRAMGPAIAAGDRSTMVDTYSELGRVHANQNDLKRAVSELEEGLDFFTLGEGPRAAVDFSLWRYLLRLCEYSRAMGDSRGSRRWCEHALWQAERTADRLGLLRCHALMAWALRDLNQLALAEPHLARALDESRHFGDRLTTAELLIERARARAARGRLSDARRCCEEALRLARSIQWSSGVEHAERAIAMLTRQQEEAGSTGATEPTEPTKPTSRFVERRRQV